MNKKIAGAILTTGLIIAAARGAQLLPSTPEKGGVIGGTALCTAGAPILDAAAFYQTEAELMTPAEGKATLLAESNELFFHLVYTNLPNNVVLTAEGYTFGSGHTQKFIFVPNERAIVEKDAEIFNAPVESPLSTEMLSRLGTVSPQVKVEGDGVVDGTVRTASGDRIVKGHLTDGLFTGTVEGNDPVNGYTYMRLDGVPLSFETANRTHGQLNIGVVSMTLTPDEGKEMGIVFTVAQNSRTCP